jgi:hypothetical protein
VGASQQCLVLGIPATEITSLGLVALHGKVKNLLVPREVALGEIAPKCQLPAPMLVLAADFDVSHMPISGITSVIY